MMPAIIRATTIATSKILGFFIWAYSFLQKSINYKKNIKSLHYLVIRIYPIPVLENYINIGIIVYDKIDNYCALRMISNFKKLEKDYPDLCLEADFLSGLEASLKHEMAKGIDHVLALGENQLSNTLRFTAPIIINTYNRQRQLDILYRQYVHY